MGKQREHTHSTQQQQQQQQTNKQTTTTTAAAASKQQTTTTAASKQYSTKQTRGLDRCTAHTQHACVANPPKRTNKHKQTAKQQEAETTFQTYKGAETAEGVASRTRGKAWPPPDPCECHSASHNMGGGCTSARNKRHGDVFCVCVCVFVCGGGVSEAASTTPSHHRQACP